MADDPSTPVSGSASASFGIPAASQLEPTDGLTGPQLNPRFVWQAGPNQAFGLILSHVRRNGSATDFMLLRADGYTDLANNWSPTYDGIPNSTSLTPLAGTAAFHVDAQGSGAAQLTSPLPPGHYEWRVVSSWPRGSQWSSSIVSLPRRFVVLGPTLTNLTVRAIARPGATSRYPGYTALQISATPYSNIQIVYTRQGRTATIVQYWGNRERGKVKLSWSCAHPGGSFSYTVTARDDQGDSKTVHGRADAIGRNRCQAMRAGELAARRGSNHARRLAELRAERLAAARQQAAYRRFVSNCNALGGTPVQLDIGGQTQTYCRAPYGGLLYVPY